jgi:hypothetical protein
MAMARIVAQIVSLATIITLFTIPAVADQREDDYVACLIGRSGVALQKQIGEKNSEKALTAAYKLCKKKRTNVSSEEGDGIGDFVSLMVDRMAGESK